MNSDQPPTVSMTVEALAQQHIAMVGLVNENQDQKRILRQAQDIINQLQGEINGLQAKAKDCKTCACEQGEVDAPVDEAGR